MEGDLQNKDKMLLKFSTTKGCSFEIAKVCLEASGYNFDIAQSILDNSLYSYFFFLYKILQLFHRNVNKEDNKKESKPKNEIKPYKNPLIYCGKFVKDWDNYHNKNFTNGQCGPTNGPNCCECRKEFNPNLLTLNDEGRKVWQGKSGRFYCGTFFGKQYSVHDGYCGPQDGMACPSCKKLLR